MAAAASDTSNIVFTIFLAVPREIAYIISRINPRYFYYRKIGAGTSAEVALKIRLAFHFCYAAAATAVAARLWPPLCVRSKRAR